MAEIHPLVITAACDHCARVRAGGTKQPQHSLVSGLLFGSRDVTKGNLHILDSTDLSGEDNVSAEVAKKVRLWTEVFAELRLVGVYAFTKELSADHLALHLLVSSQCEDPSSAVFLRFDDVPPERTSEVVPLACYRLEHMVATTASAADAHGSPSAASSQVFIEVPYRVTSSDVENIAMERLMASTPAQGRSAVEIQNDQIEIALILLSRKIEFITATLERVIEDKSVLESNPASHQLLRLADRLSHALQALATPVGPQRDYLLVQKTISSVEMVLACAMKANGAIGGAMDAYNLVYGSNNSLTKF
eukprot:gene2005-2188_t